jgi:hypothetical protein
MAIQLSTISNPVISRGANEAARDMAIFYEGGTLYCFYSSVTEDQQRYQWCLEVAETTDCVNWSPPRRLTTSELNFSSPGNIIRHQNEYVMCVQSYPSKGGVGCGSEAARLWLMRSKDLVSWDEPKPMRPEGCQANWTESHRQIDPYIVEFEGRFWCFSKTSGQFGLLVSEDLEAWEEASPDAPALGQSDTPGGAKIENPCAVRIDTGFAMFFSRCGEPRKIGVAYSENLLHWHDAHLLDFPELSWGPRGVSAATVLDLRTDLGVWLMAFHGELERVDGAAGLSWGAAIGLAWSKDLEHWSVP